MRRGFGKRNEYERRDYMRSKTISSGRKEKRKRKREIDVPVTMMVMSLSHLSLMN
jgi:hypothetical protein